MDVLETIQATTLNLYDLTPPKSNVRYLFPLTREVPPWADTFSSKKVKTTGRAEPITLATTAIPRVNANVSSVMQGVVKMSIGYYYDIDEVEKAMALSYPLSEVNGKAARNYMFQLEDEWAILGYPSASVMGVENHPNIPVIDASSLADDVAKLGSLWLWISESANRTGYQPDTLVLPRSTYLRLMTTFVSPSQLTTVLDYWSRDLGVTITYHPRLTDAICYNRINSAALVIPRELTIEPVTKVGLRYDVTLWSSFGGLYVFNESIARFTGL